MRRRELIVGSACLAAALPLAANAQQAGAPKRVVIDPNTVETDVIGIDRARVFEETLRSLGWRPGSTVLIESHWTAGSVDNARRNAARGVASKPDAAVTTGTLVTTAWTQATRTVPIIFVHVPDPVGAGIVDSQSRPTGNVTGFTQFEFSLTGKWVELLKDLDPRLKRVGVMRDVATPSGTPMFAAIQAAGHRLSVDIVPISMNDEAAIERGIKTFAQQRGALAVPPGGLSTRYRKLIIDLAIRHRLATVFPFAERARDGGLMSYGPNHVEFYRNAARYVDRILKGEKPSDLPVQAPTRYELVINLKTAKALGIEVPPMLQARADEVIE